MTEDDRIEKLVRRMAYEVDGRLNEEVSKLSDEQLLKVRDLLAKRQAKRAEKK